MVFSAMLRSETSCVCTGRAFINPKIRIFMTYGKAVSCGAVTRRDLVPVPGSLSHGGAETNRTKDVFIRMPVPKRTAILRYNGARIGIHMIDRNKNEYGQSDGRSKKCRFVRFVMHLTGRAGFHEYPPYDFLN
jgi:hypothetical protein